MWTSTLGLWNRGGPQPLSFLDPLAVFAPSLLPMLLDAALKGVAILTMTALATLAMRRSSAAARHLVWFLGTLSLLILPLLSAALPGWYILPRWTMNTPAAVQQPIALPPLPPGDEGQQVPPVPSPAVFVPAQANSASARTPAPFAPTLPSVPASSPLPLTWQAWILLTWLTGTLLLLAYVTLGFLSLCWLGHRSSRITAGHWPTLLRQLSNQLGLRRPVELLTSPSRTMPMTWGLWRTRLLLPEDSATWTADQRRAVLLHELAHARRWDCLTQLIVQIACALYWFNPLVWLAWHRIQTERERACDDLVLGTGTKPSTYAEQLLHIASDMPAVRFSAAAIAMARPSSLEGRLRSILDSQRNRCRLTTTVIVVAVLALLAVVLLMAPLRSTKSFQAVGDPIAIELTAIRPDGSDKLLLLSGKSGGSLPDYRDDLVVWDSSHMRQDLIFQLPQSEQDIQFIYPVIIHAAGTQQIVGQGRVTTDITPDGRHLAILRAVLDREYAAPVGIGKLSVSRQAAVEQIDVAMSFYAAPRGSMSNDKPRIKVFHNVPLPLTGRSMRNYAPYLQEIAVRLNLPQGNGETIRQYGFKSPQEAVRVIDLVRGYQIQQAWQAVRYGKPLMVPNSLSFEDSRRIRAAAASWLNASDSSTRATAIQFGLWAGWPEFVAPALRFVQSTDRRRDHVAYALSVYSPKLDANELDQVKNILLKTEDRMTFQRLWYCFVLRQGEPAAIEAMAEMAHSPKSWLWWQAIPRLAASKAGRSRLLQLTGHSVEMRQRILVRTGDASLIPRATAQDLKDAYTILPDLLKPSLVRVDLSIFSEVLDALVRHADQPANTELFVRFLQQLVAEWDLSRMEGNADSNWWAVDRTVKYLNHWHGVNIGFLGDDITEQTRSEERFDWKAIAAEASRWHETRIDPATQPATQPNAATSPEALVIVDSLADAIAAIGAKYPELANYQKDKVKLSQGSPTHTIRAFGLSFAHNFNRPASKQAIEATDFGAQGLYVEFLCGDMPAPGTLPNAMTPPALELPNLRLYVWTDIKTHASPSPGLVEELTRLLQSHTQKLKDLDQAAGQQPARPATSAPATQPAATRPVMSDARGL